MKNLSFYLGTLVFQCILICSYTHAQKHDYNWVAPDSIGIDFNDINKPKVFTTFVQQDNLQLSNAISDSSGKLQFYVYGIENRKAIYRNAKNELLLSSNDIFQSSGDDGIILLPQPSSKNRYFVIKSCAIQAGSSRLFYNLVGMSDERGTIIKKNVPLMDSNANQGLEF